MVAQQVVSLFTGSHGHAHAAGVVVLAHRRAVVALVIVADVHCRHVTHGGLDAFPVAVVDVAGIDPTAGDAGHVVLCIVGQGHGLAAVDALGGVAVGVIPVALRTRHVGHRVLVRRVVVAQRRAFERRDVAGA